MSRSDDLSGRAEDERGYRERRTAAAVLARYARTGGAIPATWARVLSAKRIDGTTIPTGTRTEAEPPRGSGLLAILAGRGRRELDAPPLEGHTPEASGWEKQSTYGYTPDNDLTD